MSRKPEVEKQALAWVHVGMLLALLAFILVILAIWTQSVRGLYTALAFYGTAWTAAALGGVLQWINAKTDSGD